MLITLGFMEIQKTSKEYLCSHATSMKASLRLKRGDYPNITFREGFGGSWMDEYEFNQPTAFYAEILGEEYKTARVEIYSPSGKKVDEAYFQLEKKPARYVGYVFEREQQKN